jgi:hypothetical protein
MMNTENKKAVPGQPQMRRWLDRAWWIWLAAVLVFVFNLYRTGFICHYTATDFRGYYASAQIAWQQGFARVYHQPTQDETQAQLPLVCPDGSLAPPPLRVTMPYLPAFVILLLPLPALEFTKSYLAWSLFSLLVLLLYGWRFCCALDGRFSRLKLFQWVICLPLLATLALGQMNVYLVVCLGEFTLALVQGKEIRSGLWLAGMLLKPHTLILLLPGLVLGRRWRPLLGFLAGLGGILGGSFLLAGAQGLRDMLGMVNQFAGPTFGTAPTMMNWRALALNLQTYTPSWLAWGLALLGMVLVALFGLALWRIQPAQAPAGTETISTNVGPEIASGQAGLPALWTVTLVLATFAATCSIAWHSHFYMLLPMIPFLIYLDGLKQVPAGLFAVWIWGPPLLYGLLAWIDPDLARNGLGLGMLGLNLMIFAWLWAGLVKDRGVGY